MDDLAAQVNDRTAAVSICLVTVGSGFRFALPEVYAIIGRHGVPLIVDGAQALGLLDVHACEPPVDFLAGTASKWLMGPAGVGFLYVADQYLREPPPDSDCVLRGGSWNSTPRHCRSAIRYCRPPEFRYHEVGFRVVLAFSF